MSGRRDKWPVIGNGMYALDTRHQYTYIENPIVPPPRVYVHLSNVQFQISPPILYYGWTIFTSEKCTDTFKHIMSVRIWPTYVFEWWYSEMGSDQRWDSLFGKNPFRSSCLIQDAEDMQPVVSFLFKHHKGTLLGTYTWSYLVLVLLHNPGDLSLRNHSPELDFSGKTAFAHQRAVEAEQL